MPRRIDAALAMLILSACGSTASPGGSASLHGSITVFAAASLTRSFTRIGAAFEQAYPGTSVHLTFAGSSTLATQIKEGAPGDVFASADMPNMQSVANAGLLQGMPTTFARNRLEIVVASGNPRHIASLGDLARPGLIVVLCDAAVPCGRYGHEALEKAEVTVKPASLESDVKAVVSKVALGEADAGIVYVTDVRAGGSRVQGIPIPDTLNVIADYPIAVLKDSTDVSLAKAFVGYVLEDDVEGGKGGQLTLRQDGFLGP
jgi:molybdate transport system substrate-binding protein